MHLETERLTVRPHTPADFEDYFGYIMEPELQRMLGLNGVEDRESALETFQWLLDKWRLDNWEFLAVVSRETGRTIGHICVQPPFERLADDPAFREKRGASLSFAIAKNERRKGLMSEGLAAIIDRLFREDGLDYLDCECTPENLASAALQAKMGFRFWGMEQLGDVELAISIKRNSGT